MKRRAEGVPVAYLVSTREFNALSFRITPDVLIPRPETELVVVGAIDALKGSGFRVQGSGNESIQNPKSKIQNVADVGTGSGAIAVAIAKHAPECRLVATDLSPAALTIAKENAAAHGVAERIEFFEGDSLSPLPTEPQFAVIASNLPYIAVTELSTLSPSVRDHEPRHALIAGPIGTEIIERLIPQVAERLLPGGWLILEVGPMIAGRVVDMFAADGRFEPATITKDLAGLARVVKSRRR